MRSMPTISSIPIIFPVVGYQTKNTVAGFNFMAPTFENVSGGAVSVQDITLSGENALEYVDNLQILDEGGATSSMYYWTADGWFDENGEKATETIAPGAGVLISTLMEDVKVTFSGAVATSPLTVTSVEGFNFVGNGTPVDVPAQSITLSGENVLEYVDNMQILDEGGATEEMYYWTADGWQDENGELCTKTIKAGDGVLISTLQAGVVITVPAAL